MSQIKIKVDPNLIGDEGKMNRKTWKAIKQKKGNSIFFPEGDLIPMVSDEFELQFVLHIVDDGNRGQVCTLNIPVDTSKVCG